MAADISAFHQAADGGHHLGGHLVGTALGGALVHAVPGVPVEQAEGDLVEGGLDGRDLGEHVDAVAVVVDHFLDAAHLAFDAAQPRLQLVLGGGVTAGGCRHDLSIHPWGVWVPVLARLRGVPVLAGRCPCHQAGGTGIRVQADTTS